MRLAVRPSAHSLPQRARAGIRGYRLSRAGALYGRYPYRLLSLAPRRRRAKGSEHSSSPEARSIPPCTS